MKPFVGFGDCKPKSEYGRGLWGPRSFSNGSSFNVYGTCKTYPNFRRDRTKRHSTHLVVLDESLPLILSNATTGFESPDFDSIFDENAGSYLAVGVGGNGANDNSCKFNEARGASVDVDWPGSWFRHSCGSPTSY